PRGQQDTALSPRGSAGEACPKSVASNRDSARRQGVSLLRSLAPSRPGGFLDDRGAPFAPRREAEQTFHPAPQGGNGQLRWPADLQASAGANNSSDPHGSGAALLRRCHAISPMELREQPCTQS